MLHVFYVTSNITARIVPPIVNHLSLDPAEVIVITDRSQTGASIGNGLETVVADFKPFLNRWKTLASDWRSLFHNRRRINKITRRQEFIAYLPGPSDQYSQQILWHPNCRRYRLFEEGLGSYCQPGVSPVQLVPLTQMQKFQLGLRVRSLGRIVPALTDYTLWPAKYGGCFGSNSLTFPDFPPPVVHLDEPLFKAVPGEITRMIIMDDFSVLGADLQKTYLDVLRHLVATESTREDRWAYKLHPRCTTWDWLHQAMEDIFQDCLPPGSTFDSLAPDTCAEDLGIAPGVTTYGYMSSCLFYIDQAGGKVISFKPVLEERNPAFHALWRRYYPPALEVLVGGYPTLAS